MIDNGIALVGAVVVAGILEVTLGEPPRRYHPVSILGGAIGWLESKRFGVPKLTGTVYAIAVPLATALGAYVLVWIGIETGVPIVPAVVAGAILWNASSLGMLLERGKRVIDSSDEDLDAARTALSALAGRDSSDLSPELVRSAAVESLAENLSDGLIAPLLAFTVLSFVSLPAAAAGAAFVKAVNTLDSMLGYPGRFGWASARLDDLVMFVPARVSAVIVGLAAGDPDAPLRARRYANKPASPNAGWPMGTLAAALNVRLEKPGAYVLNEVANYPTTRDGYGALKATRRAGIAAYGIVCLVGVVRWL